MYALFDDGEQARWQIAERVERSTQQLRAANSGSAACRHMLWRIGMNSHSTSEVIHAHEVRSAAAVLHPEPLSPGVKDSLAGLFLSQCGSSSLQHVEGCCSLHRVEPLCTQQVPSDILMRSPERKDLGVAASFVLSSPSRLLPCTESLKESWNLTKHCTCFRDDVCVFVHAVYIQLADAYMLACRLVQTT